MYNINRLLIALSVFISGTVLVPFVELPQETFSWTRYANVYQEPELFINYTTGKPGSYFTLTGMNFPAGITYSLLINGKSQAQITTDGVGSFSVILNTDQADPGFYIITLLENTETDSLRISNAASTDLKLRFLLDQKAPLREIEGDGPVIQVPKGLAMYLIHLPTINR